MTVQTLGRYATFWKKKTHWNIANAQAVQHNCRQLNTAVVSHEVYNHYDDVIMGAMASQITSLTIVYSTVYSGSDQRKHQSSASLAFVWGFHREPVNSPHRWPVTRKMFPFDDVIICLFNSIFIQRKSHQDPALLEHDPTKGPVMLEE